MQFFLFKICTSKIYFFYFTLPIYKALTSVFILYTSIYLNNHFYYYFIIYLIFLKSLPFSHYVPHLSQIFAPLSSQTPCPHICTHGFGGSINSDGINNSGNVGNSSRDNSGNSGELILSCFVLILSYFLVWFCWFCVWIIKCWNGLWW